MSVVELQQEEREVLSSIYEGDGAFKELTPTTYQYKFGEDNDPRSLLLEISWGDNYPTDKPTINLETFYNKHITQPMKDKLVAHIDAEAEQWLGCAMTYTLFQSVQEYLIGLTADQPETISDLTSETAKIAITSGENQTDEASKRPKKDQLTKAQKRRQWNRVDGKGERPRGWDWVDIVKHLSQTGSKPETET